MTYTEHDRNCNIFKESFTRMNGCDCYARFARAPMIIGPHEKDCPYLGQMPVVSKGGHFVPLPVHGICYCSAHPDHDEICTGMACWERRKGVSMVRPDMVA